MHKYWIGLAGSVVLLTAVPGCGSDDPEDRYKDAVEEMREARDEQQQALQALEKKQNRMDELRVELEKAQREAAEARIALNKRLAKVEQTATQQVLFNELQRKMVDNDNFADSAIRVTVNGDQVILDGWVAKEKMLSRATRMAEEQPGVKRVINKLVVYDGKGTPPQPGSVPTDDSSTMNAQPNRAETASPETATPAVAPGKSETAKPAPVEARVLPLMPATTKPDDGMPDDATPDSGKPKTNTESAAAPVNNAATERTAGTGASGKQAGDQQANQTAVVPPQSLPGTQARLLLEKANASAKTLAAAGSSPSSDMNDSTGVGGVSAAAAKTNDYSADATQTTRQRTDAATSSEGMSLAVSPAASIPKTNAPQQGDKSAADGDSNSSGEPSGNSPQGVSANAVNPQSYLKLVPKTSANAKAGQPSASKAMQPVVDSSAADVGVEKPAAGSMVSEMAAQADHASGSSAAADRAANEVVSSTIAVSTAAATNGAGQSATAPSLSLADGATAAESAEDMSVVPVMCMPYVRAAVGKLAAPEMAAKAAGSSAGRGELSNQGLPKSSAENKSVPGAASQQGAR